MKNLNLDLQGNTVAVSQAVANYKQAIRMGKKGLVSSSIWDKGFNPNYPRGYNKALNRITGTSSINRQSKIITLSNEKNLLKQVKKECINKDKLTTVFSNAL
jgi:hypothetical protein